MSDVALPPDAPAGHGRRWPLVAALALGVGLVLAPVVFQMFARAPLGGQMIDEFAPFMAEPELEGFATHLATIDAAHAELTASAAVRATEHPATSAFIERWPAIHASMGGMLADIQDNVDNYRAVAALPPFPLFPWFFVVPGLLVAGVAGTGLRSARSGRGGPGVARALGALGLGLVLAPVVFQMFSRAPQGGQMIDEFRPLMTEDRVAEMQASFLTIGNTEGELRNGLLPGVDEHALPATRDLVASWPTIGSDMAPMIGAMADNLDNFAAVAALPPFALFPWFFVVPGIMLAGLASVITPEVLRGSEVAGVGTPRSGDPLEDRPREVRP